MSDTLFPNDHAEIAWSHWLAQHVGKNGTEQFVRSFYEPLNVLDKALWDLYTKRWLNTAEGAQLDGIGSIVGISRVVPNAVYLPFFGFASQPSGRAFGEARLRRKREPWAQSSVLGDVEYRALINLKIALNNGHGTAEEIMQAFNTTLRVTRTRVDDFGNANARVYINDFIYANDPRAYLLEFMIPKAAGVKLHPYYVDADHIFGFANQGPRVSVYTEWDSPETLWDDINTNWDEHSISGSGTTIYYGFGIGVLARRPESNIPPIVHTISIWDRNESIWDAGNSLWDQRGIPG